MNSDILIVMNPKKESPCCTGVGGLYGGGGEKGGAPGQGFVVPGPHKLGLFAKLKKKRSRCEQEKHQGFKKMKLSTTTLALPDRCE